MEHSEPATEVEREQPPDEGEREQPSDEGEREQPSDEGEPAKRFPWGRDVVVMALQGCAIIAITVLGIVGLNFIPSRVEIVAQQRAPTVVPTPPPVPDPAVVIERSLHGPYDPAFDASQDPDVIVRFVRRLARVNEAAGGKKLVVQALYLNSDGVRYYLAVVTSCKDLTTRLSPARRHQLREELRLDAEFQVFSFVQTDENGQWGYASCEGSI